MRMKYFFLLLFPLVFWGCGSGRMDTSSLLYSGPVEIQHFWTYTKNPSQNSLSIYNVVTYNELYKEAIQHNYSNKQFAIKLPISFINNKTIYLNKHFTNISVDDSNGKYLMIPYDKSVYSFVISENTKTSYYTGVNAFGATAVVTSNIRTGTSIISIAPSTSKYDRIFTMEFEYDNPKNIFIYAVLSITDDINGSPIGKYTYHSSATLDSPTSEISTYKAISVNIYKILFVDKNTKQIVLEYEYK